MKEEWKWQSGPKKTEDEDEGAVGREQKASDGTGVQESANQGLPPTTHTSCNPMPAQTPHLDSGALGETEVVLTMLCLPGIGAPGVADNDRLIEAGIEVKCQI